MYRVDDSRRDCGDDEHNCDADGDYLNGLHYFPFVLTTSMTTLTTIIAATNTPTHG
jgi:hypothetical protein